MQPDVRKVPAWDLPTRLFHWTLVVLIIMAPITNKLGVFFWHKLNGYLILTLILYRLLWGIVGGTTARFSNFVRPFAAFGYGFDLLRGKARHFLGHNPLGGMMVLLLLFVVGAQAVLGLMTLDDIPPTVEGPFASKVAESTAELASSWHRRGFGIILACVALHVAAIVFYRVMKKENLVRPMITGLKDAGTYEDAQAATYGSLARAALCFVIAFAIVFGGIKLFGSNGAFM
ncbi:MAG: cytochrome b/b6 domain-containing protein [Proteobacteria bacterium]|nr:cytochrome b/b6 domain-containing protein [Pseudomonadota bacterium]